MGILAFMLTLVLVVVVHELGHFLFCKLFGVYVKPFSIGIGPKLLRKRWGETEYVISAIPFGGYVKMAGEGLMEEIQDTGTWEERKYPMGTEAGNMEAAGLDDDIPPERHFFNRPAWQRGLVFLAGPIFNLVFAILLTASVVFVVGLPFIPCTTIGLVPEESVAAVNGLESGDRILEVDGQEISSWNEVWSSTMPLSVAETDKDSDHSGLSIVLERGTQTVTLNVPVLSLENDGYLLSGLEPQTTQVGLVQRWGKASELGLEEGDIIETVDGQKVTTFGDIARLIKVAADREVAITWSRNGTPMSGSVVPQLKEIEPGVSEGRISIEPYYEYDKVNLWQASQIGFSNTMNIISRTADMLRKKPGLDSVGGPVRIGQVAGEMLRWSFSRFLFFAAFFSVNLFLLNLLPIPVLDGGHVLFLIFEVLRGGKPVPERWQAIATQIGLIVLLLFMVFVFVWDIWKVSGH